MRPKRRRQPSSPGRGQGEGRTTESPLTDADLLARFDETAYLRGHPDVAAAVAAGTLPSGRDHFDRYGLAEGRNPCPVDRRARLLDRLDVAGLRGAEIGALNKPVVSKSEGNILYIDHTDRAALCEIFAPTGMDVSTIVDVDAIWGEKRLIDCLPEGPVDYILASHVVEHVPDLLGWLLEVSASLVSGGQLRLAVPDRRYTFDLLRRESGLADVLDANLRRARAPLPRAVLEFLLLTREVSAQKAWRGQIDRAALERGTPSVAHAMQMAREVLEAGRYIDSHCWIFTPCSFAQIMEQLARAKLLGMMCADFHDTAVYDAEFFVTLRPTQDHDAAGESWRGMQQQARA